MKLAHFVVTRFCLRGRRMHGGVDGPWFGSVDPLKARTVDLRLKLLETTCLPGLASQTSQEFTWVLLVDARLREDFKERLRSLARARDRVCLHEHRPDAPDRLETLGWLAPLLADRPEYVLTTLNDDDDVLPRRFVEVVQSHVFDLDERGRAPPYKLMGARRVAAWDMVFTPDAPLGWAAPWRGAASVPSCGFTLLCRYPAFDFSVLGMMPYWAETYFDFRTPSPAENVSIYRQLFLGTARDVRAERIPVGDDAFFDASPRAGAVLMSNHGANLQSWRLSYRPGPRPRPEGGGVPHRRVLGAETFPDVSVDWDAARRHARHFSPWRVGSRLLAQKLYGHKGGNLDAVRRLGERVRSLLHTRYCGPDPEHLPYVSAARAEDGGFRLRPPDPDWRRFMLPTMNDKLARFMAGERAFDVWPPRFPPHHARGCADAPGGQGRLEGFRKLGRRLGARARAASRLMSTPSALGDVAGALLHGETAKAGRMALTILQDTDVRPDMVISRKYRFVWLANPKVASRSIVAALLGADPEAEIVYENTIFEIYARYPETKGYYSFAFVRHPFDRAISYHAQLHCSREGYEGNVLSRVERVTRNRFARFHGLAEARDFDGYCEWLNTPYGSDACANRHFLSQHLVIRAGQDRLPDFVGRLENLRADLDRVAAEVGMPTPALPMLNTMAGWQATPEALQTVRSRASVQLTERNKALLRKRYAEDFKLGGYSS